MDTVYSFSSLTSTYCHPELTLTSIASSSSVYANDPGWHAIQLVMSVSTFLTRRIDAPFVHGVASSVKWRNCAKASLGEDESEV